jgi:hypothetical protein
MAAAGLESPLSTVGSLEVKTGITEHKQPDAKYRFKKLLCGSKRDERYDSTGLLTDK